MIGNTIKCFHGARLGNQMFQMGMLFSIWKKTNQRFFQPRKNEQFWNCFDVDIPDHGYTDRYMGDYGCPYEYYTDIYKLSGGTSFNGYFQNRLYIEEYRKELTEFYKFKKEHSDYANTKIQQLKNKYNLPIVSVHFRRGDFVEPSAEHIWGNLSKSDYYNNCFMQLEKPCVYLIFSDDISWCKGYLKKSDTAEFMDIDEYKSLCLMTKVDVNIIANSTFSWFGAFLNQNSKVYMPSKWTGKQDHAICRFKQNFCLDGWNSVKMEYQ
jgi:hypothetical protein